MDYCYELSDNGYSRSDYTITDRNCRSFFKKIGVYMLHDFDSYDFFNSVFTTDKFRLFEP